MISPVGRGVLDLLREDDLEAPEYEREQAEHLSPDDPRFAMLKMKRKRQQAMMRQMLINAGYGDLAKMATISRDTIDDEGE